ncbi:MAG: glycerophosphodiester phosphodiesterase [Gemmatimonadetes bacterium]|nr:glycerophosphodiester phosphodiesterase [Gemmatimonadota bacterium]
MPQSIEIIAHRGFSAVAPENTLASLEAAVEAGADAVEFDLHTAACGTPVLFHDAMLSRTTNGVGPLRRRTLEQLKALDAGKWFSKAFEGERIPSFAEALEHLRGRIGRVYAEVKGFRELEDLDRMVRIARGCGMLETVTFISMNWTSLDRMRGQAPDLTIGYIVDEAGKTTEALQRAAGDPRSLVDLRADLLGDPDIARRAATAGIDLAVWTVDDTDQATRVLEAGVRRITTNQVAELVAWQRGR